METLPDSTPTSNMEVIIDKTRVIKIKKKDIRPKTNITTPVQDGHLATQNMIIPEDHNEIINIIIEKSYTELNTIMDNWCKNHEENFSGGKMRNDRGEDIENFVKNVVYMFQALYGVNVYALKGADDKKELILHHKDKTLKKDHQVDIHIYKNDEFIAVIECKAYLDSCYYVRACDDFRLFRKFGYNIKQYIFSLENSIDLNTKAFTDAINDYVCDDIFYMLDGKRSSNKPIYDKQHKKIINKEKLVYFITSLQKLLV